jgi:hypothetical protein
MISTPPLDVTSRLSRQRFTAHLSSTQLIGPLIRGANLGSIVFRVASSLRISTPHASSSRFAIHRIGLLARGANFGLIDFQLRVASRNHASLHRATLFATTQLIEPYAWEGLKQTQAINFLHNASRVGQSLDVWRVEDGDWSRNVGMNLNYPYPIAPQW